MTDTSSHPLVKFSLFFIRKWRISLSVLLGVLAIGLFTYTNVLKRESMPPVEIPTGMVMTPYFVNNVDLVNQKVTTPIENTLATVPEVKKVVSSTDGNISFISVEFNEGTSSKDGINIVKDALTGVTLPQGATPSFMTYDAGRIDGSHDILFAVVGEGKSVKEIQVKAQQLADLIAKDTLVSNAEVLMAVKEEINPLTGKPFEHKVLVSRTAYQKDDSVVFTDGIYIGITKKNDSVGSIELAKAVNKEIKKAEDDGVLNGYKTVISIGEPSIALNEQIDDLKINAIESLFIVLVVIAFLINWRASIVTVIFIPTVLAATFIGFNLIGYSINTMTLFALILVLGLFVDDAVVVIEAIDAQKQSGKKGLDAVARAIQKVGYADILGTFTTMLVFIPMAMISGVMGDFIRIMPITVILALAISLVIALSVIPFISNILIAEKADSKKKTFWSKVSNALLAPGIFVTNLGSKVGKLINYYLSKPLLTAIVVIVSIILMGYGVFAASKTAFSVFPPPKNGPSMAVNVSYPDGTTVDQAEVLMKKVENVIKAKYPKEVVAATYFGSDNKSALVYLELTPMDDRDITTAEMVENLNKDLVSLDGVKAKALQPSAGPVSSDYPFQMQVFAENTDSLKNSLDSIKKYMLTIELNDNVKVEDVVITDLASVTKIDGRRYATIRAKLTESDNPSGDLQTLINKIKDHYNQDELSKIKLEKDALEFNLGMESEMTGSFNSALVGIFIALGVMYMLLVFRFDSFTQPFLVFLGIPFSFVLLFPGLNWTDNPMSFFVLLGITALTGILANNIIMLLDFARIRVVEENNSPKDAIVGAIKRRFRPLVATSLITILGLLPLALNDPFWASLALTIIFGLVACTTLVIFVLPAYYVILENTRAFVKAKIHRLGK